jgi:hypothetical protein
MHGLSDIDFRAIQQTQSPSLIQDAQRVIKVAEYSAVAVVVLQAVAAFSALTLSVIAWKTYTEKSGTKRRSSRRNPKRRSR